MTGNVKLKFQKRIPHFIHLYMYLCVCVWGEVRSSGAGGGGSVVVVVKVTIMLKYTVYRHGTSQSALFAQ